MDRLIYPAVVVLFLAPSQDTTAQVRLGQADRAPAPRGRAQQQPAPSPPTGERGGFRSTLKLVTPPDVRAPRSPFRNSALPFFDLLPFWYWDSTPSPYRAMPMAPEGAPPGGLQLDVQPWSAEVYADGVRVGKVEDFRGYYHHLELGAGPHFIEIVADDYEPLGIDVAVVPGRTITYRGTLSRYK